MATATSSEVFEKARSNYWALYYGKLSLVEGYAVKKAMQCFGGLVPSDPANKIKLPVEQLTSPAYNLTLTLKNELTQAWKRPFGEVFSEPADSDDRDNCAAITGKNAR